MPKVHRGYVITAHAEEVNPGGWVAHSSMSPLGVDNPFGFPSVGGRSRDEVLTAAYHRAEQALDDADRLANKQIPPSGNLQRLLLAAAARAETITKIEVSEVLFAIVLAELNISTPASTATVSFPVGSVVLEISGRAAAQTGIVHRTNADGKPAAPEVIDLVPIA